MIKNKTKLSNFQIAIRTQTTPELIFQSLYRRDRSESKSIALHKKFQKNKFLVCIILM